MADNTTRLDALGALATVASDNIGGVDYQRIKVGVGADGTYNDVAPQGDSASTAAMVPIVGYSYNRADGTWNRLSSGGRDGETASFVTADAPMLYNGATLDRQRANTEGTLLSSAARTATTQTSTLTNYNARGVSLYLQVSVAPGVQTLQVSVQGFDPASAGFLSLVDFATFTTTGARTYLCYPGAVETVAHTNVEVQGLPLPRSWRAVVTHSGASSWTYSLGYSLVV